MSPLQARVVYGGDPVAGRPACGRCLASRGRGEAEPRRDGGCAAADREQLHRVGEFREVAHSMDAVGAGESLPAAVTGGQRAGVRGDHHPAAGRVARSEQDDRDVALRRAGQGTAELVRLPNGLQHQGEDPRFRQSESVVKVGRGRGNQFLAGGDRERVADPAADAQHRGEHRAGVGD